MPLNITDGSLSWSASIDTKDFDKKLDEMEASLQGTVKDLANTVKGVGNAVDTVADHIDHLGHDMADSFDAADKAGKKAILSQQQLAEALKDVRAEGKNAKAEYNQLNTAFHNLFHGKSGAESLGSQWTNGIKQGKVSIGEFIGSLKLTDKQLAELPAKLEKAGYVAKGTFSGMAGDANSAAAAINKVQSRIMTLEGATRAAGGGVKTFDPKALGSAGFVESFRKTTQAADEMGDKAQDAFNKIKGGAQQVNNEFSQTEDLVKKVGGAIAAYMSFQAIKGFVSDIARVRGEFEALEVSFTVLLKSKEKADQLMAEITQLAATTPFNLQDVAQGARQLLALGVEATKVTDLMRRMGDIAAGGGVEIDRIIRAYGQVKALGRVRNEELLQLAEAGVPIYKELAKVLGVAEDKVGDLVNTGVVGFDKLHKVVLNLTDAGGLYAGMMEETAKTVGGQISNLQDAWSNMLNDIGKSNEGAIKGGIGIATTLIDNYEKVIDILKILVAMYGTYRAALIAQTAVVQVYDVATKKLSISQTLHATATTLATRAHDALKKSMLANPYVLAASAIAGMVAALIVFRKTAEDANSKARLLADAQKKVADNMAEAESKVRPYLEALKDANLSENQRLDIYKKLQEIDPKIVEGMDAKTLSYEKLKTNVDLYLAALREQYRLEANKEAVQASIKEENRIKEQIKLQEELIAKKQKAGTAGLNRVTIGGAAPAVQTNTVKADQERLEELKRFLKDREDITRELGKGMVIEEKPKGKGEKTLKEYLEEGDKLLIQYQDYIKLVNNKADAEAVQKALTAKMESLAPGDKAIDAYKKKIAEVNEIIKRYALEGPKSAKAQEGTENKINALLEQRKSLIEAISDAQAKANQTGMGKQASEVDKINERYDDLIDKVDKYNRAVDVWNKRNPKNQVQRLGQTEIDKINSARQLEISNELMKEDVKNYEKSLKEKSDLYKQYEASIKDVGQRDADKLYDKEKVAFDTYLDYLKAEMGKFGLKIGLGVELNLADKEKMKLLAEELSKVSKEQAEQQIADTKRVMVATLNAAEQRKVIEANYLKEVEILRKTYTGKDLEDRERVLKDALNADLKNLASHLGEQSELYRQMNGDIYRMANDRINNEIALLEKQLKQIENKDPGLAKAIREAIEEWKKLVKLMNGTPDTLDLIELGAEKIGPAFADLASSVEGMNAALAGSLRLVAELASGVTKAAAAYKVFKEAQNKKGVEGILGQISGGLGLISAAVGVISLIDSVVSKAQERKQQQYREEKQRQVDIIKGEAEINQLYRERERSQVLINKLRIEGLEAERRLLEEQKKQVDSQAAQVLAKLATEYQKGYNPLLNPVVLPTGETYQQAMSLAGKTFEELEKLAAMNLLNDRSMQLFETLKKLKEEGADITRILEENERATNELFTGTTAESLRDAIMEGLKQGKKGIKDFAGTFKDAMRDAMQSVFEMKTLQPMIEDFYKQFSEAAKSGGALTEDEVASLEQVWNSMVTAAGKEFEALQKFSGGAMGSNSQNSLQGALKALTEETGQLLAGQMGGMRLAQLELLKVAQQNLSIQNRIQNNTAVSATKLTELIEKLNRITGGTEKLNVKM